MCIVLTEMSYFCEIHIFKYPSRFSRSMIQFYKYRIDKIAISNDAAVGSPQDSMQRISQGLYM